MYLICGVDGCPGGWVVITKDLESGEVTWRLYPTARELFFSRLELAVIAIDIPIGLLEKGARDCDQEARKCLGFGRASSVFTAPLRSLLSIANYREACDARFQIEGKQLSKQAWNIFPKIRQVDELLRQNPTLQTRVREVHPEVCFYELAGRNPMRHNKKTLAGIEERRQLLAPVFGSCLDAALAQRKALASGTDDVLDAFAALWTAERIALGQAYTLPADPQADACRLRMEMVV